MTTPPNPPISQHPVVDVAAAHPAGWPVALGVPWAAGELQSTEMLGLQDPNGNAQPLSARALVCWPDGSVRWALLSFEARQSGAHSITRGDGAMAPPPNAVRLEKSGEDIVLDNGLLRVLLATQGPGPISAIEVEGKAMLARPQDFSLWVNEASSQHEKQRQITVLENSPQRARVRIEGAHFTSQGQRCLLYRLDVELWAGWPSLRLDYHFFHQETGAQEIAIDSIQARFRFATRSKTERHFLQMRHGLFTRPREVFNAAPVAMRADKSRSSPFIEDSAMLLDDTDYPAYLRPLVTDTAPWLGLRDGQNAVYLQMHDFVEMRPGRIWSQSNELILEVWPQAAGPLQLPQGRSRRQTLTVAFLEPGADAKTVAAHLNAPLHEGRALVEHPWLRRCDAFEQSLVLEPGHNLRFEKYLRRVMQLATPQDMFDLGDTIEDSYVLGDISQRSYQQSYQATGRLPLKRGVSEPPNAMLNNATGGVEWAGDARFEPVWSNNEYDGIHALCSEIMRNARHDLWKTLRHFARHNIEVDFVWFSDDPWQHYGSPAHSARHNSASAYPSHMWTQGLLEYHCLSGDADALEVAVLLGDTILKNFGDPERGLLLKGFNREVGWPVLALVHLADLTGEERFWTQLEEFVQYLMAFDRQSHAEPVNLSNVNPRHSMDRQIAGSFFGYASMIEGLDLYARLRQHKPLRLWLTDFLLRLKAHWWQTYREGCAVDGRCVQGMAIGYELTGDEDFLRLGMVALEELTDSIGWHHIAPNVKSVATSYRAYIRFLHHAQQAGLLQRLEYPTLRGRDTD